MPQIQAEVRDGITKGRMRQQRHILPCDADERHASERWKPVQGDIRAAAEAPRGQLEMVEECRGCTTECRADEPGCAQATHIQEAEYCLQELWR